MANIELRGSSRVQIITSVANRLGPRFFATTSQNQHITSQIANHNSRTWITCFFLQRSPVQPNFLGYLIIDYFRRTFDGIAIAEPMRADMLKDMSD
jgi:hypothetical protein